MVCPYRKVITETELNCKKEIVETFAECYYYKCPYYSPFFDGACKLIEEGIKEKERVSLAFAKLLRKG